MATCQEGTHTIYGLFRYAINMGYLSTHFEEGGSFTGGEIYLKLRDGQPFYLFILVEKYLGRCMRLFAVVKFVKNDLRYSRNSLSDCFFHQSKFYIFNKQTFEEKLATSSIHRCYMQKKQRVSR